MRVAAYHPWVYLTSGVERYLLNILDRSRHDWTLYTHRFEPSSTFPGFTDHRVVELRPRVGPPTSVRNVVQAVATMAVTRLPSDDADVSFISLSGLSDFVLARAKRPVVGLCHSPMKPLHDPQAATSLRTQKPMKYAAIRTVGPAFQAVDRRLWGRLDAVLANSEETRRRIVAARLAPETPVDLALPGVDTDRFRFEATPKPGRLLVAGRISWHKNIELAIEALRILTSNGHELELVIAGLVDVPDARYLARLRELAVDLPVRFELNPTDSAMTQWYASSEIALFTPRNEDFGIVPLEAMACGTPVVAVDNGGPRETVETGVCGVLAPADPARFADAVLEIRANSDGHDWRAAARSRAEQFSWQACVRTIDATIDTAAGAAGKL